MVAARDDWPDRLRINALIQGDVGVALYAHLREGSLLVRDGQAVDAGERIASAGNSGNSTMPHLHFHVMDRTDPWEAQGVYCGFRGAEPGNACLVPALMKTFHAKPLTRSVAHADDSDTVTQR